MAWSNGPHAAPGTPPADHLVPEAGGHPARLAGAAAESVRAANHATVRAPRVPSFGLLAGADASDAVGEVSLLAGRLPQRCRQLAALLHAAPGHGTLTGAPGAPELAATHLRQAGEALTAAYGSLDAAAQALGGVGGWLSPPRRRGPRRPGGERLMGDHAQVQPTDVLCTTRLPRNRVRARTSSTVRGVDRGWS